MDKCDPNAVLQRGPDNYQNTTAFPDTVADYSAYVPPGAADNILDSAPCDVSVYVGAAVRMAGATVLNALADSITTAHVIGIVVAKPTATTCNVQLCGITASVLSGLTVGSYHFLSDTTAGLVTTSVPTAADSVVINLGQPYTATRFIVQITTPLIRAS
jgi:hypothetical protein